MIDKWNKRFLDLAGTVASWSKDPSTKCGAVIVRPDKTIASVGYNGFPRGMDDDPSIYADRELKYPRIIHAEVNAILNARERLTGCTLYTWPFPPCDRCAVQVIQAGITSIVSYMPEADAEERWGRAMNRAADFCSEAGVDWLYYTSAEDHD